VFEGHQSVTGSLRALNAQSQLSPALSPEDRAFFWELKMHRTDDEIALMMRISGYKIAMDALWAELNDIKLDVEKGNATKHEGAIAKAECKKIIDQMDKKMNQAQDELFAIRQSNKWIKRRSDPNWRM